MPQPKFQYLSASNTYQARLIALGNAGAQERANARAKRAAQAAERQAARQAACEAGRAEREAKAAADAQAQAEAERRNRERFAWLLDVLQYHTGGFCQSIAAELVRFGRLPTGRGLGILREIYAKDMGGRVGSKDFEEACERFDTLFRGGLDV